MNAERPPGQGAESGGASRVGNQDRTAVDPWTAQPVQTALCSPCGYKRGKVLPFCIRCCRLNLTPLGPLTAADAAEVASWAASSTGCAA